MASDPSSESMIFNAARRIQGREERSAYLDEACGTNVALRVRLEKLLAALAEESQFLEQPATELGADRHGKSNRNDLSAVLEAGLVTAFDENQAVVLGNSGHSVLKSLGQTIDMPHVTLRESSDATSDPIQLPNSAEIPPTSSNSRYRLDGEIARGGMGAIIKGRDNDLGRDLAIKVLLDQHKDRPEVISRFVEEAQIGGQLQHPGIAPVYELGQFADRRPFFSMKLVKGDTLSKLLSERSSPSDDRGRFLGIFEQICQTMAYAHSRGVIHRDLKPANIMVGAFGEVQVMDWGLAKVLTAGGVADEKRARDTQLGRSIIQTRRSGSGSDSPAEVGSHGSQTQMGSVMGTPAYMPPEQALGEIDNLDERADVFGLGAILCEILTGLPPYVAEDGTQVFRMASRGKIEDCHQRLDECGADADLIALAKHCLKPEVFDRPRNANDLAGRVTGYLETVEKRLREAELQRAEEAARADAQSAQAVAERQRAEAESKRAEAEAARVLEQRKRLRITLALAASILLVLTAGIFGTAYYAIEADRARVAESKRAEREERATIAALNAQKLAEEQRSIAESARSEAERSAAKELAANEQAQKRLQQIQKGNTVLAEIFTDVNIGDVRAGVDPLEAVLAGRLLKAAEELEGDSIGDPFAVAELQFALGRSLVNLGYPKDAIGLLTRSRDTVQSIRGDKCYESLAITNSLAEAHRESKNLEQALALFDQNLVNCKKNLGGGHELTLTVMNNLGSTFADAGKFDQAIALFKDVLAAYEDQPGVHNKELHSTKNNLATAYQETGDLKSAIPLYEEALQAQVEMLGKFHRLTLNSMYNLASAYREAAMTDRSLSLFEETLRLQRSSLGPNHPDTIITMIGLAHFYLEVTQYDLALPLVEEALELSQSNFANDHEVTLRCMNDLGRAYHITGNYKKALEYFNTAYELRKKKLGADHDDTLTTLGNIASTSVDMGEFERAVEIHEQVLKLRQEKLGEDHPKTLAAVDQLAWACSNTGDVNRAQELLEGALQRARATLIVGDGTTTSIMANLAGVYSQRGDARRAIPLFEEALELLKSKLGGDHPQTLSCMGNLASTYHDAGEHQRAFALQEKTLALTRAKMGDDNPSTLQAIANLAAAHRNVGNIEVALPMMMDVLERQKKILGENHPSTLATMNNLGSAYHGNQQLDLAIPLLVDAIERMKATFGVDHPSTVLCMNNLALAYMDSGNFKLAQALYEEVLPLMRTRYEADDQMTIDCMINLGETYRRAGKLSQAISLLEEAMPLAKSAFGEEDYQTVKLLERLAFAYSDAGDSDKALGLLEEVLRSRREKLGSEHPSTINSANFLGYVHRDAGNLDRAKELFEQALETSRMVRGVNDIETLICLNNLASTYWKMNRLDESIPLFEDAAARLEANYGRDHRQTLFTMANLGVNYKDAGRLEEAIPLLEKGYEASQRFADLEWVPGQLLEAYGKSGQPTEKAKQLASELVAKARVNSQAGSPELASSLASIGSSMLQFKAFAEAESVLRECLAIREKEIPDSWLVFNTKSMLGGALMGQQKLEEAESYLLEGYEGLKPREESIIPQARFRVTEALERLVQYYTARDQKDKADRWQAELDQRRKAESSQTGPSSYLRRNI